jgi:choline dehydrogenase-like flavoprotein
VPVLELSDRQRRALEVICDTFAPGDGLPSATQAGVPDAILEAVSLNPRAAERRQFAQLLSAWDTRLVTALGGGGLSRFSRLPPERREAVLLSWCDSRLPQRRAAFQALRKGVLLMYWMLPEHGGRANPAWEAIGYPGPLGPPADPPPRALQPLAVSGDTELDCDVAVVGSGAGGATAAAVLAKAGLDVIVLEAGGHYEDADFDGGELSGFSRLYLGGGGMASHDQSVGLLAGQCLGGGTVVNYTASFRTPDEVREEWAGHGVPAFLSEEYGRSLDSVCERIGVNEEHVPPSARDDLTRRGLAELGWHAAACPRNVRGCDQGAVCGQCGFGCTRGAKQSALKTWLADAQEAGARMVVRAPGQRVVLENGAARGVEARTEDGHRVTVRSRAVVAACGALHTPALLRRSGLSNRNIGRHLRLHPVTIVWGVFDEEIHPWQGSVIGLYSDEHRWLDGGYGVKYETAAINPDLLIAFAPWRGSRAHAELALALDHTQGIGVLLRDRDGGEVKIGRDGQPVVRYRLSDYDAAHMRTGLDGAARILEAAGARRVFSSHARWVAYEPGADGGREAFVRDADGCGWGPGEVVLYSFHIMGTARMGGSSATSACDPGGQAWEARDLVVCDGSAFPTSSGVNPMVSIEAVAHLNASALAARLA